MARKDELRLNPAYQMWLATNAWQRIVRRKLEPLNLTHVQYTILGSLAFLLKEGKAVMQADICRFGSLDPNVTSEVVRSLVARDLVSRTPHPKDRRAVRLSLTDAGAQLYEEGRKIMIPTVDAFYAPLGDDLTEFVRMLGVINEAQLEEEPES